jgi:hypothetical protein
MSPTRIVTLLHRLSINYNDDKSVTGSGLSLSSFPRFLLLNSYGKCRTENYSIAFRVPTFQPFPFADNYPPKVHNKHMGVLSNVSRLVQCQVGLRFNLSGMCPVRTPLLPPPPLPVNCTDYGAL